MRQAETLYRSLIDRVAEHPEKGLWQVRLGLVVYLQKKYQAVIDLLTPLAPQLASPDQKAEALYLIGLSHFQLGQFDEAATQLQAATAASSAVAASRRNAAVPGTCPAQTRASPPGARDARHAAQVPTRRPTLADQVYYHLGEYRYAVDQYPEALAAYDEVIQKYPQSTYVPFALYGKGWASLKSGQYEPAAASFTTLIDQHRAASTSHRRVSGPRHVLPATTEVRRGHGGHRPVSGR